MMPSPAPLHCRPEAFDALTHELEALDTTAGLLRCAVAVSMHEMQDVDADAVQQSVTELSESVAERLRSDSPRAVLAHAHEVLFDEARFHGNKSDYYNPRNSYLSAVLKSKQGLPISLVLLYKCVVEPLGIEVKGINAPGHFLAGVVERTEGRPAGLMLVDPYDAGRILSREEAFARIEELAGGSVMHSDQLLRPATHAQWLTRLVQNLIGSFDKLGRRDDMAAMMEMRALIESVA